MSMSRKKLNPMVDDDEVFDSGSMEAISVAAKKEEVASVERASSGSRSDLELPKMVNDDDADTGSVVRMSSNGSADEAPNLYTSPVHHRTGSGLTRKWSVTGTDHATLTLGEAQARRLEKKGEFSATLDDEAGTVTLNTEDFKKVMAKLGTHKMASSRASKNLVWLAFGYLAVSIGFIAILVGLMNWRIEASKESHVVAGQMQDTSGKLVSVGEVVTYGKLFDLPHFDAQTLTAVSHLTVVLPSGAEESITVSRVSKVPGTKRVKFTDDNNNSVDIDASTQIAVATIDGNKHVVKDSFASLQQPGVRRRLQEEGKRARLYTASEFKTMLVDNRRRLSQGSAPSIIGWAAFAMRVADAILDSTNAESGRVYKSMYIAGSIEKTNAAGSQSVYAMEVHVDRTSDASTEYILKYSDGKNIGILDTKKNMQFSFDKDGKLSGCATLKTDSIVAFSGTLSGAETAADNHNYIVSAKDDDGNTLLATIDKVVPGSSGSEIPTPNATACTAFSTIPVGTGVNQSVIVNNNTESENRMDKAGARRLAFSRELARDTISRKELAQAAESAYPENKIVGGWTVWRECSAGNAVARFMYKHNGRSGWTDVISFSGTNGITAVDDCESSKASTLKAANRSARQSKTHTSIFLFLHLCRRPQKPGKHNFDCDKKDRAGKKWHKGFLEHLDQIVGCVNNVRQMNEGWGYDTDYIVVGRGFHRTRTVPEGCKAHESRRGRVTRLEAR